MNKLRVLNYIPYPTYLTCLRDLRDLLALRAYVPACLSFFTCLKSHHFLRALHASLFLRALRVFRFYVPYVPFFFLRAIPVFIFYVSSFFKCAFNFLIWFHIFTCLQMFPRRVRWNLSDKSNDFVQIFDLLSSAA